MMNISFIFVFWVFLELIDVSNFGISSVISKHYTFPSVINLNDIDISNIKTSSIITMTYILSNILNLETMMVFSKSKRKNYRNA